MVNEGFGEDGNDFEEDFQDDEADEEKRRARVPIPFKFRSVLRMGETCSRSHHDGSDAFVRIARSLNTIQRPNPSLGRRPNRASRLRAREEGVKIARHDLEDLDFHSDDDDADEMAVEDEEEVKVKGEGEEEEDEEAAEKKKKRKERKEKAAAAEAELGSSKKRPVDEDETDAAKRPPTKRFRVDRAAVPKPRPDTSLSRRERRDATRDFRRDTCHGAGLSRIKRSGRGDGGRGSRVRRAEAARERRSRHGLRRAPRPAVVRAVRLPERDPA